MKRRRILLGKKDSTLTVKLYQGPYTSTTNTFPVYLIKNGLTIQTNTETGYIRTFKKVSDGTYTLQSSNNKDTITTTVTVKGDTVYEWTFDPYFDIYGIVYLDNVAFSNCTVRVTSGSSSSTFITDSSGEWHSSLKCKKGDTVTVSIDAITASDYNVNSYTETFEITTGNSFDYPLVTYLDKVYKRDVTIHVTKNGDTYSSSATKPTITFNGESQTVNPNGNTFSGVLDGTYTINVGSTTYNDSKSVSVDVSSGNTSFTVDVVGYYDLKVTYQWYINDVYNNGVNYCYGATVYLRNSSGSNLTNTTTNSSGLATISASNYKVGNNSYTLYTPAVKLTNGPYVYSSSYTIYPNGGSDSYSGTYQLYCYQYDITFNLYRSGDNSNWTGTPSCTLYVNNANGNGIIFSSSSFSGGSVRFTGVWWQPSYYLYVSSDTYNNSLTTSNYTFGSSTTISNDVTVTGKYYVRFQLYNSVTGTNFSNCQVQAYLRDSSGNNICVGYTDNSGIITFNGSTSYLLTYGSSFKVYVPSQSVTYNSTTYSISPTTFSKTLSTSYGTLSSGNNWFYFSGNTVTTSTPATQRTWSANLTSNSYDSNGSSYIDYVTDYREGMSLYFNSNGCGYQVLAEDSNYLASNSFLQYSLGGKACWGSYNWNINFEAIGNLGLFYEQVANGLTGMPNFGVRVGSESVSTVGYGRIGYNVALNNGSYTYPTLLIDNYQSAKWSLYRGSSYWPSGQGGQQAKVQLSYNASTGTLYANCQYYLENSYKAVMHDMTYSVTLYDDDSPSYVTIALAGWCQIKNVSVTAYIK